MAGTNDFLPFATGAGANVLTQAQYAALAAVTQGFGAGLAASNQFNKVWRQSAFVSAMIGQFINEVGNLDALDNGNLAQLQTNFIAALRLAGPRIPLLAPTSFYVDGSFGNDASPGTSPAPWQTLAKAVTELKSLDMNGQVVTVYCQNAFATGLVVSGPFVGAAQGGPRFTFEAGSSITDPTANAILVSEGATITINGPVTLSAPNTVSGPPGTGFPDYAAIGMGLYTFSGGVINMTGGLNFGPCGVYHMNADTGIIRIDGSYTVSGNAQAHWIAAHAGILTVPAVLTGSLMVTVSFTGARTFSSSFAIATNGGLIISSSSTTQFSFPSGVVGPRYLATLNAVIDTGGSGPSFFPGNATGTTANGGQYI